MKIQWNKNSGEKRFSIKHEKLFNNPSDYLKRSSVTAASKKETRINPNGYKNEAKRES